MEQDLDSADVSLSELQLGLMRVLWARGEASTAEVAEALRGERDLAHTTVATLLTRLEKRGLLSSRREGRALLYTPRVSEADVQRSMVGSLVDSLFAGRASALVSHLLDARGVDAKELAALQALLKQRKLEARHD
ncbi:BlaI/MecI/CopY family transcriptional regulator [Roseateles saccharophilus]|uniref:Putative transcriptional regulator n=1 Tax=Roseateles saccharophilus TaxID=304 RepID=A0A4R3V0M9_ROSSA|nr:BlaI/MecI/CopY family transcriptional regulator [Roseateles saccharophilus]MDG0832375.1 BlaI/MecI/CopY family transcriptional regulator [Roseateles saccharophilus]TCU97070.1 putative transcriptional regulator [Roseateles saccharophilus]